MTDFVLESVKKIPRSLRNDILDRKLIENSFPASVINTPMQELFNIYEEFLDPRGEHDDWHCNQCITFVYNEWKKFKPYMESLRYENA